MRANENSLILHPKVELQPPEEMPPGLKTWSRDKKGGTHETLLEYLLSRVRQGRTIRDNRLKRYATIDKTVATWHRLSEEDIERERQEYITGKPQALMSVIPLIHTHLEDLVAFYAGVYSPNSKDVFHVPKPEDSKALKALVAKMNGDGKHCGYYGELTKTLRGLLKYNLAGFHLQWAEDNVPDSTQSYKGNKIRSLDMYNTFWDPSIKDPSKIRVDAEWAAEVEIVNRYSLVKMAREDGWWGLDQVIVNYDSKMQLSNSRVNQVEFFKYPPNQSEFALEAGGTSDPLAGYFSKLESNDMLDVNGHELMTLYCRLDPAQFELQELDTRIEASMEQRVPEYQLWRFKIVDGQTIVHAEAVQSISDEIPFYMGFMNVDDMGEATKSVAELLKSFQGFLSFLFNIFVAGMRGSVFGVIGINPNIYDTSKMKDGDTAAILLMKGSASQANMNPQLGFARLQSNVNEIRALMEDIGKLMQLIQQMFPSQALPSQIAGIDRAVQSQVAAVLQGINRRLHMLATMLDSQIMHPMRMQAYRNIGQLGEGVRESLSGLTNEEVQNALGSGLKQLNREVAAQMMQQLLFALIQTPDSAQANGINLMAVIEQWGNLSEIEFDIDSFKVPPNPAPTIPGTNGTRPAAGAPGEGQANPTVDPAAVVSAGGY